MTMHKFFRSFVKMSDPAPEPKPSGVDIKFKNRPDPPMTGSPKRKATINNANLLDLLTILADQ